ncbi:AAA family ATPase [Vibrio lentus]|nr:AAA family ATPase [Vibrio lentus]
MFQNLAGDTKKKRKMKIENAFKALTEEAAKLVNQEELKESAIFNAESNGIVFIDEIDQNL